MCRALKVFTLTCFLLLAAVAAEAAPLRIAVLPVLDETDGWLTEEGAQALQQALQQEVRIPLNGTLQIAAYLPGTETLPVLRQLEAEQRQATGKRRINDKELAPLLAERLNADLVVYLRVKTYYQRTHISFEHGTVIETSTLLRLEGYDRRAQRLIHDSASRQVLDEYMLGLDVQSQSLEALDEMLARARLRTAIFPLLSQK